MLAPSRVLLPSKAAIFASFFKATRLPFCGRATAIANVMIPAGIEALLRKWAEQTASFVNVQHAYVHLQSNKTARQARNGQSNVIGIFRSIAIQTYLCRHQS